VRFGNTRCVLRVALPVARAGAMQLVLLGRASSPLGLGAGVGAGGLGSGGLGAGGLGSGGLGAGGLGAGGLGAGGLGAGGLGAGLGAGGLGSGGLGAGGLGAGGGAFCEGVSVSPPPLEQPVSSINIATTAPRHIGATKVGWITWPLYSLCIGVTLPVTPRIEKGWSFGRQPFPSSYIAERLHPWLPTYGSSSPHRQRRWSCGTFALHLATQRPIH